MKLTLPSWTMKSRTASKSIGIEIYDLMEALEAAEGMSTQNKVAKIRASFVQARKDIAVIHAKKRCKKEEMAVLDVSDAGSSRCPPSSGQILTNKCTPQNSEMENM
jgi:hypothetical protein